MFINHLRPRSDLDDKGATAQVTWQGKNLRQAQQGYGPSVLRDAARAYVGGGLQAFAVLALLLPSSPVLASVFEISRNGAVSVRDGGGAATWEAPEQAQDQSDAVEVENMVPLGAMTLLHGVAVPERFTALIEVAAASAGISPALLAALVTQESGWNPRALSVRGAMGLAQLMPATARELGVDPHDPAANLTGGARYLRRLLDSFGGNVELALAAYNAGPGRVRKANGVPAIAETQAYVRSIVQRVSYFHQEVR